MEEGRVLGFDMAGCGANAGNWRSIRGPTICLMKKSGYASFAISYANNTLCS